MFLSKRLKKLRLKSEFFGLYSKLIYRINMYICMDIASCQQLKTTALKEE